MVDPVKRAKAARSKLTPEQMARRKQHYLEERRSHIPEMKSLGLHPDKDGKLPSGSGEWPIWSKHQDMKRNIKDRSYWEYEKVKKRAREIAARPPPPPPKERSPGMRDYDELEYNEKGTIQYNKIDCLLLGSRLVHYQEYIDHLRHRYYDHGSGNFWNYILGMGHEGKEPTPQVLRKAIADARVHVLAFNLMIMREALQATKECNGTSINAPKMQRKPWGGDVRNPWGNIDEALDGVYTVESQMRRFKEAYSNKEVRRQVEDIIIPALNTISNSLDDVVGDGSKTNVIRPSVHGGGGGGDDDDGYDSGDDGGVGSTHKQWDKEEDRLDRM
jgi:hypothetical protein